MTRTQAEIDADEMALATLIAEALDLCVRARSLDDQSLKKSMREVVPKSAAELGPSHPEIYGRSGTPYLWVQNQYDKDLQAWEDRAKETLTKMGFDR